MDCKVNLDCSIKNSPSSDKTGISSYLTGLLKVSLVAVSIFALHFFFSGFLNWRKQETVFHKQVDFHIAPYEDSLLKAVESMQAAKECNFVSFPEFFVTLQALENMTQPFKSDYLLKISKQINKNNKNHSLKPSFLEHVLTYLEHPSWTQNLSDSPLYTNAECLLEKLYLLNHFVLLLDSTCNKVDIFCLEKSSVLHFSRESFNRRMDAIVQLLELALPDSCTKTIVFKNGDSFLEKINKRLQAIRTYIEEAKAWNTPPVNLESKRVN